MYIFGSSPVEVCVCVGHNHCLGSKMQPLPQNASCLVYPCWRLRQTLQFRKHSLGQTVYSLRGGQHCRLGLGQLLLGILFDCSCSGTGRGSLVGLDAGGSLLFLCREKRAGDTDNVYQEDVSTVP